MVKPTNTNILVPVLGAPLLRSSPPGTYESERFSAVLVDKGVQADGGVKK